MKLEPMRIVDHSNQAELAGLFYRPEGESRPIGVVLAHGFTSGKYSMDSMAGYLAERGYLCVTFDAVGHKLGCSDGEMHRICQSADNLKLAAGWMRDHAEIRGVALVGHSMGAAAAIQVAAWERAAPHASQPLAGIACLCMGVQPTAGFASVLGAAMLKQRSDYVSGAPARELLSGLDEMLKSAGDVGRTPVLLIAARNDVLLPVQNVEKLGQQMGPHAELRTIDALHLDAPDRSRGVVYRWLEGLQRPS